MQKDFAGMGPQRGCLPARQLLAVLAAYLLLPLALLSSKIDPHILSPLTLQLKDPSTADYVSSVVLWFCSCVLMSAPA